MNYLHFAADEYDGRSLSSRQSIVFGVSSDYVVDTSSNSITVHCLYLVAEDIGSAYKSGNYDIEDYWYYCCEFGKCGAYTGGQPNDAAKILTKDLRKELVPPNYRNSYYFIEPYSICFAPLDAGCDDLVSNIIYDEFIDNNTSMWYSLSDCMSPSDLSFHYAEMIDMIEEATPPVIAPNIKSVVYLKVLDDILLSVNPKYVHKCGVTYGTIVELQVVPPAPLDLTDYN